MKGRRWGIRREEKPAEERERRDECGVYAWESAMADGICESCQYQLELPW